MNPAPIGEFVATKLRLITAITEMDVAVNMNEEPVVGNLQGGFCQGCGFLKLRK
jgi:hypothetical protein